MAITKTNTAGRKAIVLPIRFLQFGFAVAILGMSVFAGTWWWKRKQPYRPKTLNFMIFTSCWTILAAFYLTIAAFVSRIAHKHVVFAVELITNIFWLASWISMAYLLGSVTCFGKHGGCKVLKVSSVLGALTWVLFTVTVVFAGINAFRAPKAAAPIVEKSRGSTEGSEGSLDEKSVVVPETAQSTV